jgi:hypothetical protein
VFLMKYGLDFYIPKTFFTVTAVKPQILHSINRLDSVAET